MKIGTNWALRRFPKQSTISACYLSPQSFKNLIDRMWSSKILQYYTSNNRKVTPQAELPSIPLLGFLAIWNCFLSLPAAAHGPDVITPGTAHGVAETQRGKEGKAERKAIHVPLVLIQLWPRLMISGKCHRILPYEFKFSYFCYLFCPVFWADPKENRRCWDLRAWPRTMDSLDPPTWHLETPKQDAEQFQWVILPLCWLNCCFSWIESFLHLLVWGFIERKRWMRNPPRAMKAKCPPSARTAIFRELLCNTWHQN